jgi:HK97 family phage portal protein
MPSYQDIFNTEKAKIQAELEFQHRIDVEAKAGIGDLVVAPIFGSQTPSLKQSEYLKSAVGWVYSAIRPIADALGAIEFKLHKTDRTGEVEEVPEHEVLDLLYRVNPTQTKYDFWRLVGYYLMLTGESPLYVNKASENTKPLNLVALSPDKVSPRIPKSGEVLPNEFLPFAGYEYSTDRGNKIELTLQELVMLKLTDPRNQFRGTSPLHAASKTVDIDTYSEDFNKSFYYNSARPDAALSTEQELTKKQRDDIRRMIQQTYGGVKNAHKTLVLEHGFKYQPLAINQKDMDFLEQQKFSRDKILSIFGTPKSVAGISDDVNLANAQVAQRVFAQQTLRPLFELVTAQLNEFLLPMFTSAVSQGLYLTYTDPTPSDYAAKLARYQSGLGLGWLTPNEVRQEEGLEEIEGADELKKQNVAPVQFSPQDNTAKYLARNRLKNYEDLVLAEQDALIEELTPQFTELMAERLIEARSTEKENKSFEIWTTFIKATDSFEPRFKEITKQQFDYQEQVILGRMGKKGIDDWLLDLQDETEVTVSAFLPIMNEIVLTQGGNAMATAGLARSAFDARTAAVQKFISDRTYDFSGEMNEHTNELIKEILAEGVRNGASIDDLREMVTETFRDFKDYRANRIARTEVLKASNEATLQAYIQSDVVDAKEWLTAFDERTSEECAELDGEVQPLGKDFTGGIDAPPLHPNCRCTLIPVIKP